MRRPLGTIPTLLLSTLVFFGFDEPPPAVSLFDGKSLEGWSAERAEGFSVKDGVLTSGPSDGWLKSAKSYKNFHLKLEFRVLKESSEGGLFFRASGESGSAPPYWPVKGYQLPIASGDGDLRLFGHGTPPPRFERKSEALKAASKPLGAWQSLSLKANGANVEVALNDVLVTLSDGIDPEGGFLGLYDAAGDFEWKNLTIQVQPD